MEHLRDVRGQREDSHMHQHLLEYHPEHVGQLSMADEVTKKFSFKVIQKHTSSLIRQVH